MSTINRLILAGRLTRDPELKEIKPGVSVCKFTIATTHEYKGKDGAYVKEPCFMECTTWNSDATRCANGLKKGSMVTVEGRIKQESWTDKDSGKERTKHVIAPDKIIFDSSDTKPDVPEAKEASRINFSGMSSAGELAAKAIEAFGDDLPF